MYRDLTTTELCDLINAAGPEVYQTAKAQLIAIETTPADAFPTAAAYNNARRAALVAVCEEFNIPTTTLEV
jgi:DNA-binding transcriptional MocR family regulator